MSKFSQRIFSFSFCPKKVAATIAYLARGAFLILLLSILFADLLEPAITMVQQPSPLGRENRTLAIAEVCLVGTLALGTLGYVT